MLHIKSRVGVRAAVVAGVDVPLATVALCLIEALEEASGGWLPARDGWVVLLEATEELDATESLGPQGASLRELPRLAVEHWPDLGFFTAVVPHHTTFGLALILPEALLPPTLRSVLTKEAQRLSAARPTLAPSR